MGNLNFLLPLLLGSKYLKYEGDQKGSDLINKFFRDLRRIAYSDVHRGEIARAERYEKMAEAVMLGQVYSRFDKQIIDVDSVKEVARLVIHSMDNSLL